jgi:hypothetical protein
MNLYSLLTKRGAAPEVTFFGKVRGCYPSQKVGVPLDFFITINCFRQLLSCGVRIHNWELLATTLGENDGEVSIFKLIYIYIYRGAQISGTWPLRRLMFLRWRLICVCPQYGTCFMSPFWRLEFWGGSQIFGKSMYIYIYIAALWLCESNRRAVTLLYVAVYCIEESGLTE